MEAMTLTIRVAPDVGARLRERAESKGQDVAEYVEVLVAEEVSRPTLDEVLAPLRADFAASGMTEDELDALVESERQAIWEEKHGQKA
jgi:hypothetical protein